MCGIFAYINFHSRRTMREILNTLLDGLQRVEYRGYDSAGVCVDSSDTSPPSAVIIRSVGNISKLREVIFSNNNNNNNNSMALDLDASTDAHIGIAHTRWATHGAPCVPNCHPQASNNKRFIVVHNGIITNFMPIKEKLLGEGYHFDSDTDTEVIAVLLESLYTREPNLPFIDLAAKVVSAIEGTYGLLMKSSFFPNELIACRKSSPLIVGFSHKEKPHENDENTASSDSNTNGDASLFTEVYFASDVNSFISHTNEVIFMENDDMAHYHDGKVDFYTTSSNNDNVPSIKPVTRLLQKIDLEHEGLSRDGYEHFMLKEIHEQPESITRTMRGRIDYEKYEVNFEGINTTAIKNLRKAQRLLFISCGTSHHSCLAVRPVFEELLPDLCIMIENAPDFMDRRPYVSPQDVCVFVSQSGETADTLLALQYCKNNGAVLVGVTNVAGSTVLREADYVIPLNAGVEVGVASTKAYTSQMVVLTLLALLLSQAEGRCMSGNNLEMKKMEEEEKEKEKEEKIEADEEMRRRRKCIQARRCEIINGLANLPVAMSDCLRHVQGAIQSLAEDWHDAPAILLLGRGYDYATAVESALKVKEVSYIHTEGIHSGELKHGPLALVDEQARVIAFCSHDRFFERSKGAIQQVKARGGRVVAVTTRKDAEMVNATTICLEVPAVVDCLQGVVNIIPLQLLAYYLAKRRGHNVDCPRNLAKSVTVQ